MEFVSLLPSTQQTIAILSRNLSFFKKYSWEERAPLLTFSRVCSSLLNHHELLDSFEHNRTLILLKEIVAVKT
jgi:hypothetical protein